MTKKDVIFERMDRNDVSNMVDLPNIMRDITKKSWGDPGLLVDAWINLADIMFIAKSNGRVVAFAIGNFVNNRILNLTATVVDKDFQRHGLSAKMNQKIIKYFLFKHPISFLLGGFYVAFRTPNPSLYESVYARIRLFPDYKVVRESTVEEMDVFNKIVEKFCPNNRVFRDEFTIEGAYLKYPELIYSQLNIPLAKNEEINNFFEKKLKLSKRLGMTMVLVGKVNIGTIVKSIF